MTTEKKTTAKTPAVNPPEKETALVKTTPTDLIAIAINQNVDVEKLEKLMELQERYEKNLAKKSFLSAMTKFQGSVPILEKKKKVAFGNTKYSYADLGEMSETLKDVLQENGLSYRWEMDEEAERFKCTCIISHIDGYSERTSLTAGKDTTGNKNDIQAIASAVKYLQRYTFIGALGLTTADEDVDGRKEPLTDNKQPVKIGNENKSNPYNEMKDAKNIGDVKKIWGLNKALQTDETFIDLKEQMKIKFTFLTFKKKLEDCIVEKQLETEYTEILNNKDYRVLPIEQKEQLTEIKNKLLETFTINVKAEDVVK